MALASQYEPWSQMPGDAGFSVSLSMADTDLTSPVLCHKLQTNANE
jgi:hypothetical protein